MKTVVSVLLVAGVILGFYLAFWIKRDAERRSLPSTLYTFFYVISYGCAWMGLPVFFLLWYYFMRHRVAPLTPDVKEEFAKLEMNIDTLPSIHGHGCGLVLDATNRSIGLGSLRKHNGKAVYIYRKYTFDQVRDWRYNIQTGGRFVGGGMAGGFQAGIENIRVDTENMMATGLFINVKDIDFPEWQFHLSHPDIKRWYEILNQAFENDSVVAAA